MSVTFLGDVFLPEAYESAVHFDNFILNLEYPITESEDPVPNKVVLKTDESYLEETFGSKPTAVCLANNHIMDYGETGFSDTLEFLDNNEIPYYGAGDLSDSCNNPLVLDVSGTKIGLCGYTCTSTSPTIATESKPGVAPPNIDQIKEDIHVASERDAEFQVVSVHWGAEEVYLPKPDDVKLAHQILDAGADVVIGHHAHRIQPIEYYQNGVIFYRLGNSIMPNISRPSYFNDVGEPKGTFKKKQRGWNRRSLAVNMDFNKHNIKYNSFIFQDRRFREGDFCIKHHQYMSEVLGMPCYNTVYKFSEILNEMQLRIHRAIDDPTRLTFENAKSFFQKHV